MNEETAHANRARRPGVGPGVDILCPEQLDAAIDAVGQGARVEILRTVPATDRSARVLYATRSSDLGALRRGVTVRLVCESAALSDPDVREDVAARERAGAGVRGVDLVPFAAVVADGTTAVVTFEDGGGAEALLMRGSAVVAGVRRTVARAWQRANATATTGTSCAQRQRRVLAELRDSGSDAAAARRLGVSLRTFHRHVAETLDVLGAQTRFQAGAIAAYRGWI